METKAIDPIVLCAKDVVKTRDFYVGVLNMEAQEEKPGKWSLHLGRRKSVFSRRAMCLLLPPTARPKATAVRPVMSVCFYDPDGALVEITNALVRDDAGLAPWRRICDHANHWVRTAKRSGL